MTVVKWNPFGKSSIPTLFDKLTDDFFNLDNLFDSRMTSLSGNTGSVNVAETANAFEIEVAVPGTDKSNFKVKVEGNQLTIIAEKKTESKTEDPERKYLRREFGYSSFQRTFTLPENIDVNNIAATHNNGILVVTLPKVKAEQVNSNVKSIDIS
ncbi:MAG: Hsp20/alpha crystallin family protein [Sphingobacteriales bacterium]|nr:MAG: Hsp20/alpha crystallin family protein [Sphingobacteriales bacterium]